MPACVTIITEWLYILKLIKKENKKGGIKDKVCDSISLYYYLYFYASKKLKV